jgi:hypothetical protein
VAFIWIGVPLVNLDNRRLSLSFSLSRVHSDLVTPLFLFS